jgi:GNAT superfamily N-acetyltransferase
MRFRRDRAPSVRSDVEIVDLPERHHQSYFACLEEWSPEMAEAGGHKACWFEQHRGAGLGVKLAVDADDRPVGMIQYVPIELSPAEGEGLYMILCVWVHGYDKGVGDVQGAGIGRRLLAAAEDDVRERGARGLAAWGMPLPVWMKASWFKRHGYVTADRVGMRELVWKSFADDAVPPRWVQPQPLPEGHDDTGGVLAFCNGWCPAANLVYERARRAADELGVDFETIDTTDRESMLRYGRSDEVLVSGRPLQRGAPPSYRTVRRRIDRHRRRRAQAREA